jgi:hypothetical protein
MATSHPPLQPSTLAIRLVTSPLYHRRLTAKGNCDYPPGRQVPSPTDRSRQPPADDQDRTPAPSDCRDPDQMESRKKSVFGEVDERLGERWPVQFPASGAKHGSALVQTRWEFAIVVGDTGPPVLRLPSVSGTAGTGSDALTSEALLVDHL